MQLFHVLARNRWFSNRLGVKRLRHIGNRTVRHEWLDQYIIESIEEVKDQATKWLWTYNNDSPNIDIGGITPDMKLKMAA